VLHKLPDGLSPELAGLATPMSNGIEWALFAAGVGYDSTVLIQGPGQQGLAQAVACKQAGASLIIVTGTTRDAARLEMARKRRRSCAARSAAGRLSAAEAPPGGTASYRAGVTCT
jgi:threonine dehydrogenase-like Zn-dependent dehydrogenase